MGEEGREGPKAWGESGSKARAAGKVGEAHRGSLSCVSQKRNGQPGAGFRLLNAEWF